MITPSFWVALPSHPRCMQLADRPHLLRERERLCEVTDDKEAPSKGCVAREVEGALLLSR